MHDESHAEAAARVLRAARANVGPRAQANPEQEIGVIAGAIRVSARRRRARAWLASGALALTSAAAAAAFVLHARTAPNQTTAASVARAPLTLAGSPVAPGGTLRAGDRALALTGADGTTVQLAARSEAALVRSDAIRWFQLHAGSIEAHVIKLAAGERFVVATPDRQVEVRGTRFRVSLAAPSDRCGQGTVTRVAVEEGIVTVQAAGGEIARVTAGETWPRDCQAPIAPGAGADSDQSRREHTQHAARTAGGKHAAAIRTEAPLPASTLSIENDLYAQAVRAERAGEPKAALRLLDLLIARFPASPLRETAETERARIAAQ